MSIELTKKELEKKQKQLNQLYKTVTGTGYLDIISEIVELELEIERECNK